MLPVPTLVPVALRCESRVDPLGIGRERPVLSWKLEAAKEGLRGLRQSAYQICAGSAPGKADLWDTGKVASSAQYGIEYRGRALGSDRAVWWSMRAWDANGTPSAWSKSASFSTGLLSERDWKGKWIGWDAPDAKDFSANRFKGAKWIWSAADSPGDVPVVTRNLVRSFDLAAMPWQAKIALTVDDRFTLFVNGREAARGKDGTDAWRTPVEADIRRFLKLGKNEIRIEARNLEKSPAGLLARLVLTTGDNHETVIVSDASWSADGKPARIAGNYGDSPWGRFGEGKTLRPTVIYRKDFVARPIRRATAHVTALGLVDLYVNGKRASDDLFTPGWTDYNKRVYAKTYDVTRLVRSGQNALGLEVGDGWYAGYVGYSRNRAHYGDRPRVRAQVTLEYEDGGKETIGTDAGWKATTGGTRTQDFLAGESFDARVQGGPSRIDPVGAKWERPKVVTDVKGKTEPFPGVPVLPYAKLKAISVTKKGENYILDFGQNLAGFVHFKAQGKRGQKVEMQFIEALNPDGTPYTANLRSAVATDSYTFAGNGVEEWEPRFTFHGFRYLAVRGLGRKPKPEEFVAVAISSATPETGSIQTSDPMINKLAKNAWWTQKMNFIDVPTDCPQRDERLGWTGDAQAYIRTASTYSDVQSFFDKWLVTLDDGQSKDGNYPQFAPVIMGGNNGGPAWSDAGVICPWTIYDVYGDKRQLAERYPAMKRFVEFCRKRSTSDLLPPKDFHAFGDWLSINANTPNEVIYEAYFAYSTHLLAKSAAALGLIDEAEKYGQLYEDVKAAFNKAYVTPGGVVKGDTQTSYVLALGFDLLDKPTAIKAAARLVANIESRKWHLSTGFVGTRDLMQVLSKIGRNDVAFRLLHNTTFPSWGFEIKNGATTVWERWDGWTPEKGFQDPGMNSFAHYAYGAVMGWVFATVGGIDNATPGFSVVKIAPKIDTRLTWAKTSYDSVRGLVRTEWKLASGKLTLDVEVPPNAMAEVKVPGVGTRKVGSGKYRFVSGWKG